MFLGQTPRRGALWNKSDPPPTDETRSSQNVLRNACTRLDAGSGKRVYSTERSRRLTGSGHNERDFEAIVEDYSQYVYNVAYRILGNQAGANDASQEAFISAYRNSHKFRGDVAVTTWLYRIAVNASLIKLRKDRRKEYPTQTGYDDSQLASHLEGPEHAVLNSEVREQLEEGLSKLPPQLRAVVV